MAAGARRQPADRGEGRACDRLHCRAVTHLRRSPPVADLAHGGCRAYCVSASIPAVAWRCRSAPARAILMSTTGDRRRSGDWKIERQADRVTGAPISSATLVTRIARAPTSLSRRPRRMQLACFIDKPVVSFSFGFKVGTERNSFLGYRFDEKPGHEIGARFVAERQHGRDRGRGRGGPVRQRARDQQVALCPHPLVQRRPHQRRVQGRRRAGGDRSRRFATCPVKQPEPPPQQAAPPRAAQAQRLDDGYPRSLNSR